ncbi:MAG: ABC transporter ATP-binding protein, partial [Pseudomonadota bacterium]|nr:ABC transporter ATP-binding protein [Pseudomonadota bacterium]
AFWRLVGEMLKPESAFYRVILIYSMAISLLSLAIPISVQLLIDTIARTGLPRAVLTLGLLLFVLLFISGVLYALRAWTMELYNRRLYSRITSEIVLSGLMAPTGWFERGSHRALFNRYFDIMTLKKNMPYLLSYGFSWFFQAVIGFVVVSLYHNYFLIFSLGLIALMWLIWRGWGWRAIESGFHLSEAKHATGAWLQGLAINNGFYKAAPHAAFALARTDRLIHAHLDAQQTHFRHSYSQLIGFLLLYALASATLLGLGGWLVIQGQLTLGQLVAAELILSAIFYGLPQLSGYLDYFYDVCAAIEELSRFRAVEIESDGAAAPVAWPADAPLVLRDAHCTSGNRELTFSLTLPLGLRVSALAANASMQEAFTGLLTRGVQPTGGALLIGDVDLRDCAADQLREAIAVYDRQTLLPLSIAEYLKLADPSAGARRMHEVLDLLDLHRDLRLLPKGLDTQIDYSGAPLTLEQALRLKLAFALLGGARIVILGQIFDAVHARHIDSFMLALTAAGSRSAVYFTRREDLAVITHRLFLEETRQELLPV